VALSSDEASDLRDAVESVVGDPTADERYGGPAMVHLTGLAEVLSDALDTTRVRGTVRESHSEG